MKVSKGVVAFFMVVIFAILVMAGLYARAEVDMARLGGAFRTVDGYIIEVVEVDDEHGFMWFSDPNGDLITGGVYETSEEATDLMWKFVDLAEEMELAKEK